MRQLMTIVLGLALAGCASAPRVVTRTVEVTHTRYVPIPADLLPTVEAPASAASVETNGDLFHAWMHDAHELGVCKPALDGIRALNVGQH